jgi:hypothetical protein
MWIPVAQAMALLLVWVWATHCVAAAASKSAVRKIDEPITMAIVELLGEA